MHKNPQTRNLKLHNPAHLDRRGYSAQVLLRGRQNGFTQWNARLWRAGKADSTGFIPMIILIILVLAAIIWLIYSRVAHSGL